MSSLKLLNSEELTEELIARGIPLEDAVTLFEENVDGNDFESITNEDLKDLGLKLGNRKKLLSLIEKESATSVVTVIPSAEDVEVIGSPLNTIPVEFLYQSGASTSCETSDSYTESYKYSKPETVPVLTAVKVSDRGKNILRRFEEGKIITQKDVREVVRLILTQAVKDLNTMYFTYQQKVNIAKAIVLAIPQLKSCRDGCEGYEQFFDPVLRVGMIEWRLKTMRKSLTPSKKRNKRKQETMEDTTEDNDDGDIDENLEDKINWLKYQIPSEVKKKEIFETMAETFKIRRKFISERGPTITDILNIYPKLKDFNGELIDMEFNKMYPGAGSFLGKFPSQYTPRIIKYCRESRLDIFDRYEWILDENLSACLMLADLLHFAGLRRKIFAHNQKKKMPSDYLISFPGENINFPEIISSKDCRQPAIVCEGDGSPGGNKFFLILDALYVDIGCCSIRAIDILFKSHYVFNVKFNRFCEFFYQFLEAIIFVIKKGPATSSVENLNVLLNRIKI